MNIASNGGLSRIEEDNYKIVANHDNSGSKLNGTGNKEVPDNDSILNLNDDDD